MLELTRFSASHDRVARLDQHQLRQYLFNDYYLRYFLSQVGSWARHSPNLN